MGARSDAKVEIRSVIQQIQNDWTAYPLLVERDNRHLVDQSTQVNPYLQVMTNFLSAEQLDMADVPRVKQYGHIILSTVHKVGQGEALTDALGDFVLPYFDLANLGMVQCHAAEVQAGRDIKGWWYSPVLINFWYCRLQGT